MVRGLRKGAAVALVEQGPEGEPPLSADTEQLIYEHIKEAPQRQMETADKLDDKMLRVFGAASVLIGLLGLSSASPLGWGTVLLALPLIPYAVTAYCALRHLAPKRFLRGERAVELPTKWKEPVGDVRRALINDIGTACGKNDEVLQEKAQYVRIGIISTSVEVVLVLVALTLRPLL
jgi:hypothetical protein